MDVIIRLMTIEDKSTVLNMMKTFYESEAVLTNGSKEIFNSDFENCINDNPYLEGYVFVYDDFILGYAMLAKSFSTEFGKECIWIEDLYLKEEYRNKGVAKDFFLFIDNKYPNHIKRLEAEKENEAALHVYSRQGYEVLPYIELIKKQ